MVEEVELPETGDPATEEAPDIPQEPAPPIYDRFLYVNVAAMRAKQLRRGALPRLGQPGEETSLPIKPERIAMEEVRRGMVHYQVPAPKVKHAGGDAQA
jgi:DNA-directed RNA polymerase subunit K/omega